MIVNLIQNFASLTQKSFLRLKDLQGALFSLLNFDYLDFGLQLYFLEARIFDLYSPLLDLGGSFSPKNFCRNYGLSGILFQSLIF